jgi:hypothetical protein
MAKPAQGLDPLTFAVECAQRGGAEKCVFLFPAGLRVNVLGTEALAKPTWYCLRHIPGVMLGAGLRYGPGAVAAHLLDNQTQLFPVLEVDYKDGLYVRCASCR